MFGLHFADSESQDLEDLEMESIILLCHPYFPKGHLSYLRHLLFWITRQSAPHTSPHLPLVKKCYMQTCLSRQLTTGPELQETLLLPKVQSLPVVTPHSHLELRILGRTNELLYEQYLVQTPQAVE